MIKHMVRLVLTAWFTLTALAGPGLCCCTFEPARPPVEKSVAVSCCCPTAVEDAAPATPTPAPGRPCPCKEQRNPVALAATADQLRADATTFVTFPSDLVPPSIIVPISGTPIVQRPYDPPVRPAADLLHVLHILRC